MGDAQLHLRCMYMDRKNTVSLSAAVLLSSSLVQTSSACASEFGHVLRRSVPLEIQVHVPLYFINTVIAKSRTVSHTPKYQRIDNIQCTYVQI